MRPSRDLDMLGDLRITSDRTVMNPIDPDDLGQQMRIAGIRLRPRRRMPLPITGHLQRIHRIDQIARGQQRLHPRTPLRLDPHDDLIRLTGRIQMLSQQLMQRCDPGQTLPATAA